MKNIAKIIELLGGWVHLRDHPIRLEVPGFMPLCVEHVGTGPRGLPLVSVAHYYEQGGDLLSDPDCTFEVDGADWLPVSFQQDSVALYQEAVSLEGGRVAVNARLERELREFASGWDAALCEQGFLAEAERRLGGLPPGRRE